MFAVKMRDMARPIMFIVVVAFVATIFVSWGMGGLENTEHTIGAIDGEKVSLQYFDRMVNDQRQRMQQMYANDLPQQQYRMIPRQMWEQEVSRILLDKAFAEFKLGATADEVFEHIKHNPPPGIDTASYFMTNGQFDTTKYVEFLNTPASYDNPGMQELENYTRQFIVPLQKLEALVKAVAQPSKAEVERAYRQATDKVQFEYARVASAAFAVDSAQITQKMIADYYKANVDSFKTDEQAELLYVSFPKTATTKDIETYYSELLQIKQRVEQEGVDFAEEAQIESDDEGSAQNGGDLGWFAKGSMVPEFEQVAFSLAPGSVSQPIQTQYGFHLIKVEERREQDSVTQVKARHILRKLEPSVETTDSLEELADSLLNRMQSEGFEAVAKAHKLSVKSTGLFARGQQPEGIGAVSGLSRFAFDNAIGDISEEVVQNNPEALYIFAVKRRLPAGTLPLADVRQSIVRKLSAQMQNKKAQEYLERAVSGAGAAASLSMLAADSLVATGVSDTVSFNEFVPAVGYHSAAMAAAFVVPQGSQSKVVKIADGFAVVKPLYRSSAAAPVDDVQLASFAAQLRSQKQQQAYMKWFQSYKRTIAIEEHLNEYYAD